MLFDAVVRKIEKYEYILGKEKLDNFLEYAEETIINYTLIPKIVEEEYDLGDLFKTYLKAVFIDRSHIPDYKYWENAESRGAKEQCYYLEYSRCFVDFQKFSGIKIKESEFHRYISNHSDDNAEGEDYFLIRKGICYYMERVFEGEKVKALIVKKKILERSE